MPSCRRFSLTIYSKSSKRAWEVLHPVQNVRSCFFRVSASMTLLRVDGNTLQSVVNVEPICRQRRTFLTHRRQHKVLRHNVLFVYEKLVYTMVSRHVVLNHDVHAVLCPSSTLLGRPSLGQTPVCFPETPMTRTLARKRSVVFPTLVAPTLASCPQ